MTPIDERIKDFTKRVETEKDFCLELFEDATIRLLAAKYAYYAKADPYLNDSTYDALEQTWYVMGRGLSLLKEDETSPCVDWNESHPKANEAIALYQKLKNGKHENKR